MLSDRVSRFLRCSCVRGLGLGRVDPCCLWVAMTAPVARVARSDGWQGCSVGRDTIRPRARTHRAAPVLMRQRRRERRARRPPRRRARDLRMTMMLDDNMSVMTKGCAASRTRAKALDQTSAAGRARHWRRLYVPIIVESNCWLILPCTGSCASSAVTALYAVLEEKCRYRSARWSRSSSEQRTSL